MSPYMLVYGHNPPLVVFYLPSTSKVGDVDKTLNAHIYILCYETSSQIA